MQHAEILAEHQTHVTEKWDWYKTIAINFQ